MANSLSPELIAQLFAQESNDPFLMLVTLENDDFDSTIRLVNNSTDVTSRGNVFTAFPMKITFPVDDGETAREFQIQFSNVSLELIDGIRTVSDPIGVTIELVLASMPDVVQMVQAELEIAGINYNQTTLTAKIVLDDFLGSEMTGERYTNVNFPGIF